MGNRGSKSSIILMFVKEQRVDGTGYVIAYLRCTLRAFEKRYNRFIRSDKEMI